MNNEIFESLNVKSTDELKNIIENDQENYRPEALAIIKKILNERDEVIPHKSELTEKKPTKANKSQGCFKWILKTLWFSYIIMLIFSYKLITPYAVLGHILTLFLPLHIIYFFVTKKNRSNQ